MRSEDLNEYKIRIEHARAQANEDLTDRLQDHETEEAVRFDRMEMELEKRREDPDDVFFAARDRRREIKQQITELQHALERQSPRPKVEKEENRKVKRSLQSDHFFGMTPRRGMYYSLGLFSQLREQSVRPIMRINSIVSLGLGGSTWRRIDIK